MQRLLFACLLLLASPTLPAWGERGHREVAAMAEAALRPATRAAALALLEPGEDSLAAVAGWADDVREQPGGDWTRPLHFINLPRDCSFRPARDCPGGACIVAAVERFAAELARAELPREQRGRALKFLVHFVADLHQPLHAGFFDDRGGNRVQLSLEGKGTNLHAVWDHDLLAGSERISGVPADLPAPGSLRPGEWARQSCRLIGDHALYPTRHRIGRDYLERHRPLAEAQLRLAAARLAAVLERSLGDDDGGARGGR